MINVRTQLRVTWYHLHTRMLSSTSMAIACPTSTWARYLRRRRSITMKFTCKKPGNSAFRSRIKNWFQVAPRTSRFLWSTFSMSTMTAWSTKSSTTTSNFTHSTTNTNDESSKAPSSKRVKICVSMRRYTPASQTFSKISETWLKKRWTMVAVLMLPSRILRLKNF